MSAPVVAVVVHWQDPEDTLGCVESLARRARRLDRRGRQRLPRARRRPAGAARAARRRACAARRIAATPAAPTWASGMLSRARPRSCCSSTTTSACGRAQRRRRARCSTPIPAWPRSGPKVLTREDPRRLWLAWGRITWRQSLVALCGADALDGPAWWRAARRRVDRGLRDVAARDGARPRGPPRRGVLRLPRGGRLVHARAPRRLARRLLPRGGGHAHRAGDVGRRRARCASASTSPPATRSSSRASTPGPREWAKLARFLGVSLPLAAPLAPAAGRCGPACGSRCAACATPSRTGRCRSTSSACDDGGPEPARGSSPPRSGR